MKPLVFFIAIAMTGTLFAQKNIITIHGKASVLSGSKNIILSNSAIPIRADGSFEYTYEIAEPQIGLIRTDSSGATAIWMEEGDYFIECNEIKQEGGKSIFMKISGLKGPLDAMIYNDYQYAAYDGFTAYLHSMPIHKKTDTNQQEINRKIQQDATIHYIDSIIKKYPDSKVLPNILRNAKMALGNKALRSAISKLSPALTAIDEIKQLQKGLARDEMIEKEVVFEDFTMKKADGTIFKLSDIKNKKLILIDFWASDCGPCRITHPRLIELYKKYADKGLEIVSVSIDYKNDAWLKAIEEDKIGHWINVSELKSWQTTLVKKYAIPFIPFRFLLDGNYKILSYDNDGQIVVTPGMIEARLKKSGL